MKPVHAGLASVVLVSVAGITALPAGSAVHPRLTRAQAVERLGRMLGAKPERLRLVFADYALLGAESGKLVGLTGP